VYSAYAPQLAERLNLSATESNLIVSRYILKEARERLAIAMLTVRCVAGDFWELWCVLQAHVAFTTVMQS
jgi:hypothetical protein